LVRIISIALFMVSIVAGLSVGVKSEDVR
jgi:hypothetical protein